MSRVAGTQYSIGSSTRRCAGTDRELVTGERFVAALVQHPEEEEFVRLDFSESVWNEGARPARPLVLFGFWRGLVPDPTAKKKLLIDDQSLVELFEQSGETIEVEGGEGASEKERLAFRFVLALILLRKRLLIQEGSRGTTMLVRARGVSKPPEGPALVDVIDPGLDGKTIAKVTGMLGAVISGETGAPTTGAEKGGGA